MNSKKYKLLQFIQKCPDSEITFDVIYNGIKWNRIFLKEFLKTLINENFIKEVKYDKLVYYSITPLGCDFILQYRKIRCKDFFDKYLFPTITMLIGYILGLLTN